mgnify:CR=1 FL=1
MAQRFSRQPGTGGPLTELSDSAVRKVQGWGLAIALGGFLFGYDTGVISGALLFIRREFALNSFEQGSVVSVLLLGCMVGALLAGRTADRLGRKRTFALEGLIFVVGTLLAVFADNYWTLLLARVVLGIAVGAASATVPIYLSEISPAEIRGRVLSLNQLMIVIGILVSYLVDLAFASTGNWRGMFGVGLIPSVLLVIAALWWLPESPQWLITSGRENEARRFLSSITNVSRADALIDIVKRTDRETVHAERQREGWKVLLARGVRPALIVGLTLAALQQFGGINTIIYYAPTIIERTGLTATNSIFYSVFIGIINLAMTIVALALVERAGRRKLLLSSLAGMTITLVLLGTSFVLGLSSVLALLFMVLYIAAFAVGMGPIFWVLVGELFPPSARGVGSSASTAVNWASNFVVGLVFLPVVDAIGQGQTFWVLAGICLLGVLFSGRFVPETRGKQYDAVDASLRARFHMPPVAAAR